MKLSEKDLDKLITEVLNERTNVKIVQIPKLSNLDPTQSKDINTIKAKLQIKKGGQLDAPAFQRLAALGKEPGDSADDFENDDVHAAPFGSRESDAAIQVIKNTTDGDIRKKTAFAAFDKALRNFWTEHNKIVAQSGSKNQNFKTQELIDAFKQLNAMMKILKGAGVSLAQTNNQDDLTVGSKLIKKRVKQLEQAKNIMRAAGKFYFNLDYTNKPSGQPLVQDLRQSMNALEAHIRSIGERSEDGDKLLNVLVDKYKQFDPWIKSLSGTKGINSIRDAWAKKATPLQTKFFKIIEQYKALTSSGTLPPEDQVGSKTSRTLSPFGKAPATYSQFSPRSATFASVKGDTYSLDDLKVDPALVSTVNAINGDNLIQKVESVAKFADEIITNQKIPKDMKPGKIASYSRMLGLLADAVQEFEAASAGTAFETFLAAMARGSIIGGESGATDVVSWSGGKPIYYSAKLLASDAVEQSDQIDKGLAAVITADASKSKQGLVYVVGFKTSKTKQELGRFKGSLADAGSQTPASIALAIFKLEPESDYDKDLAKLKDKQSSMRFSVTCLLPGGKEISLDPLGWDTAGQSKVSMAPTMREIRNGNHWFAQIPILPLDADDVNAVYKLTSQVISRAVMDGTKLQLKYLMAAHQALQLMELDTQDYTAQEGSQKDEDHIDYINKTQRNYSMFKTSINYVVKKMFHGDRKTINVGPADAPQLKENKNNLDDILDKLIQEVILTK